MSIPSLMSGPQTLYSMFKVGDVITLEDKVGKITAVHTDQRIGFLCEGKRKHTYDIEFKNVPEEEITLGVKDGRTDTESDGLSPREETEST